MILFTIVILQDQSRYTSISEQITKMWLYAEIMAFIQPQRMKSCNLQKSGQNKRLILNKTIMTQKGNTSFLMRNMDTSRGQK